MIVCEYCGQPVGTPQPTVVLSKMPSPPPAPKPNKTPVIVLSVVCAVLAVTVVVLTCLLLMPDAGDRQGGETAVTTTTVPPTTTTQPSVTTTSTTTETTAATTDTTASTTETTSAETTTTTKAPEVVTPSEQPLKGTKGQVDTSDGDGVNVRSGPSTDYEVIGGVAEDKEVDVLAEQDGWYYVECEDGFGWIHGEFLKLL